MCTHFSLRYLTVLMLSITQCLSLNLNRIHEFRCISSFYILARERESDEMINIEIQVISAQINEENMFAYFYKKKFKKIRLKKNNCDLSR